MGRFASQLIDKRSIISGNIYIGNYTTINRYAELFSIINGYRIVIGKFCAIAPRVLIRTDKHSIETISISSVVEKIVFDRTNYLKTGKNIIIGNDVWIGYGAVIMPGVQVGDGAVIGANSVVTKNVQPYEIVGGVPAIHLRYRFSKKIIGQLLDIKWWDWDISKIKRNKQLFSKEIKEGINLKDIII